MARKESSVSCPEETRHETEVMRDVVSALDTIEDVEGQERVMRYVASVFGFVVEF